MKRQQLRLLNRRLERQALDSHPHHETAYGVFACPACMRWLEEKRAALRRLPPVGRPA